MLIQARVSAEAAEVLHAAYLELVDGNPDFSYETYDEKAGMSITTWVIGRVKWIIRRHRTPRPDIPAEFVQPIELEDQEDIDQRLDDERILENFPQDLRRVIERLQAGDTWEAVADDAGTSVD